MSNQHILPLTHVAQHPKQSAHYQIEKPRQKDGLGLRKLASFSLLVAPLLSGWLSAADDCMVGGAVSTLGVGNTDFGVTGAPIRTLRAGSVAAPFDTNGSCDTGCANVGKIDSSEVGDSEAELGWFPNNTCARFSNAGIIIVTTSFWKTAATYSHQPSKKSQ
jgi:hypothetical protein